MIEKNLPNQTGFYWARDGGYKWWNLIVRVYGESPFFGIDAWHYSSGEFHARYALWEIDEFGPKIADEAPNIERNK